MLVRISKIRLVFILSACFLISAVLLSSADTQPNFPETISVLKSAYNGEILAERRYLAYALKAKEEGYPNIAHFFTALSTSESIHARNFKQILFELGVESEETPKAGVNVSSTKKNLKHATNVELEEIDSKYPDYINMIKPEGHKAAVQNITYAWKSEMQHRDLIKKIQSGTGVFFGALVKEFKKSPTRFHICHHCGSTLIELPENTCPICNGPVSNYKEAAVRSGAGT